MTHKSLVAALAMTGLLAGAGAASAFETLTATEMDAVTAGASATANTSVTFLALAQSAGDNTCANHNCNTLASVSAFAVTTVDTSSESSGSIYLYSETIQAD